MPVPRRSEMFSPEIRRFFAPVLVANGSLPQLPAVKTTGFRSLNVFISTSILGLSNLNRVYWGETSHLPLLKRPLLKSSQNCPQIHFLKLIKATTSQLSDVEKDGKMPYGTTMCRPNERLQVRETKQTIKVFYSFVYQRASGQNHINSAQQHESDFSARIEYSKPELSSFQISPHLSSINTSTTTPKHAVLPCPLRALPCLLRFGVFCQRTLQVCQTK